MHIWMNLLLVLQLLSALAMIGLVLMQHGKGADMGASFGSGASGSLFGASGSANFLSRSTAVLATVFFVATLVLALLANAAPRGAAPSGSVLDRAAAPASAASVSASAPAVAAIPVAPAAPPASTTTTAPAVAPAPTQLPGSAASAGSIPVR